jgi:hypothetical protein
VPALTRLALASLLALALLGPTASTASAGDQQLSMMMDDDNLLYRGDAVRDQTLTRMKQLGVDVVRVTVLWSVVADRTKNLRKRGSNPRAYPKLNWDRYDRLVRACRALGLIPYFNVTPPGPGWSRGKGAPRGLRAVVKKAWKPNPAAFARFVRAVGKRFSGTYRDENDERELIPAVRFWSLLNESNQAGWLAPQWERRKRTWRMASPRLARELYLRSRVSLDRTGHGKDVILFGETAPLGSSSRGVKSPIRPRKWLRGFLCDGTRGNGCNLFDKYGPIRATGYAHHPYTKDRAPAKRDRSPDSITMANIIQLPRLLDSIGRRTDNVERGLPIYLTEFGFETNPPDPYNGVSLERQALWNQQGEWLAFRQSRVFGLTQFLLRDVPPVAGTRKRSKAHWFTYQAGLYFADGRPKPSATAYVMPFLVTAASGQTRSVWGQLRFRPNGLPPGFEDTVQIQWKPADNSADFADIGAPIPVTNTMGYYQGNVDVPGPGTLRALWKPGFLTSLPQPTG